MKTCSAAARVHANGRAQSSAWKPRSQVDPEGKFARAFIEDEFVRLFAPRKAQGEFAFLKELGDLRNVVNHGFTGGTVDHASIRDRAATYLERVAHVTRELILDGVIGNGAPLDQK